MSNDITAWGMSIQGRSHLKYDVVCQDAHQYTMLPNGWMMGAVADGVGSAARAETGSRIAVQEVVTYCKKNVGNEDRADELLELLPDAYEYALDAVMDVCREEQGNLADYDATLTVAIYNGKDLVYGQEGDGGILVRTAQDGELLEITNRHKGLDGISVRPLRSGRSSWEFGRADECVDSVLLLTDGMLEALTPSLLAFSINGKNEAENKKHIVYKTMAEFFMNPYSVFLNPNVKKQEVPAQIIYSFMQGEMDSLRFSRYLHYAYKKTLGKRAADRVLESVQEANYSTWAIKQVTDDMTVLGMFIKRKRYPAQDTLYYIEPNWGDLQEKLEKKLYNRPHSINTKRLAEQENDLITSDVSRYEEVMSENFNKLRKYKMITLLLSGIIMLFIIGIVILVKVFV